jgi:hypothetical protein
MSEETIEGSVKNAWDATKVFFINHFGKFIVLLIVGLTALGLYKARDKFEHLVPVTKTDTSPASQVQEPASLVTSSNDIVEEVTVTADPPPPTTISDLIVEEKVNKCGNMLPIVNDVGDTVACKLPVQTE